MTDVVHEYPNTFVLPEGAGKRNDPPRWITEGHYDGLMDYAIATHRPWEQVIRLAIETGNPGRIEFNLRLFRDRVVDAGGVTWAHPWWMVDPEVGLTPAQMLLEVATLATIGELFVAYDMILDPAWPPSFIDRFKAIMRARRDYPALGASGKRRRLPTFNDKLYYAFMRETPAGDQQMLVVLNFQNEHRVTEVYLDQPVQLTDIFNSERHSVPTALQLSLPPYGYKIYQVTR